MKRIELTSIDDDIQALVNVYPEDGFVEINTTNQTVGNVEHLIQKIIESGMNVVYIGLPNVLDEEVIQIAEAIGDKFDYIVFSVSDAARSSLQNRPWNYDFTFSSSLFRAVQEAHRLILSKNRDTTDEEYVHYSENEDTDKRLSGGEYKEEEEFTMPQ